MEKKELYNKIINVIDVVMFDKSIALTELMNIIYDEYKGKTLKLFLEIQDLDNKKKEDKLTEYYLGTEESMNMSCHIARSLLEEKTSRQAKDIAKYLFNGDNIASLITICKVYFSTGDCTGASNNGRWFFNKFKDMLISNKEKYSLGGDSRNWADNFNHSKYIDLVLSK